MRKLMLGALGAAILATSVPAAAQDLPLVGGDYWDVTGIKIDDGHFADYADFLVSDSRKQNEYAKSKGWIKAYYILSNNNARKDEPDLYLVTVSDRIPTPAEQIAREQGDERLPAKRRPQADRGKRAPRDLPPHHERHPAPAVDHGALIAFGSAADCAALHLSP